MPLYRAEVYTAAGEKKQISREAAGENDLLRWLASQKYTVVSVNEQKPREFLFPWRRHARKLTLSEQHTFCTTLSSFMKSGLSMTEVFLSRSLASIIVCGSWSRLAARFILYRSNNMCKARRGSGR